MRNAGVSDSFNTLKRYQIRTIYIVVHTSKHCSDILSLVKMTDVCVLNQFHLSALLHACQKKEDILSRMVLQAVVILRWLLQITMSRSSGHFPLVKLFIFSPIEQRYLFDI